MRMGKQGTLQGSEKRAPDGVGISGREHGLRDEDVQGRCGDQWKAESAWTSGERTLTVMLAWAVRGLVRRTSLGGSPG